MTTIAMHVLAAVLWVLAIGSAGSAGMKFEAELFDESRNRVLACCALFLAAYTLQVLA